MSHFIINLFGDDYASQFFFDNKESDLDELKEKFTKLGTEVAYNSFHLARELLRQKFRYQVRYAKHHDLVALADENQEKVIYVQLHAVSSAYTHVVSILGNQIVDGTFEHTIQCNEESIQWLIKEEHYNFTAYFIEITPKVEKNIKKRKSNDNE